MIFIFVSQCELLIIRFVNLPEGNSVDGHVEARGWRNLHPLRRAGDQQQLGLGVGLRGDQGQGRRQPALQTGIRLRAGSSRYPPVDS